MLLGIGITSMSHQAHAAPWYFNAAADVTEGSYKDSILRDKLSESGITISGDYLDQGGVTTKYSKTRVSMKNSATATDQKTLLLSGRLHFRPDAFPGRLTVRLDGYRITNNDVTADTDRVAVVAPQVGWLSKGENLYVDLGYASSRYQNQLSVRQYTPTIGFGFNTGADWIQLRSYQIRGLNPDRAAGKSSTSGLDMKWTHFFTSQSALVPTSLTLGVATGERIYAVDMDAQSIANLADLNKGAATLGLGWNITKSAKLFVLAGQSRFRNVALSNDYKLNVGYASLSLDW
jgi:hypothetical protein